MRKSSLKGKEAKEELERAKLTEADGANCESKEAEAAEQFSFDLGFP